MTFNSAPLDKVAKSITTARIPGPVRRDLTLASIPTFRGLIPSVKYHRLVPVAQDPPLNVPAHGVRQYHPLQVTAAGHLDHSGLSVCCGAILSGVAGVVLDKTQDYLWVHLMSLTMVLLAAFLSTMMNPIKAFKQDQELAEMSISTH